MTDQTPSSMPPPGWYDDPYGQPLLRYWNGFAWTDETSLAADAGLSPFGDWMNRTFQLAFGRAGHLLAMTAVLLLPVLIAQAVLLWLGLKDGVMRIDDDPPADATLSDVIQFEGFRPGLIGLAAAGWLLYWVAQVWLRGSFARQGILAARGGRESWSGSVLGVLPRLPRLLWSRFVVGVTMFALVGLPFVAIGVGAAIGSGNEGLAAVLVGGGIIGVVVGAVLALWIYIRWWMGWMVAVGSPAGVPPLRRSWSLSTGRTGSFALRGLVLLIIAAILSTIVSSVVSAFIGFGTAPAFGADETIEELAFADFFAGGLVGLLLSQVVSGLANQVGWVLTMVGSAIVYDEIGGPHDLAPSDVEAVG